MKQTYDHAPAIVKALGSIEGVDVSPNPPQSPLMHINLRSTAEGSTSPSLDPIRPGGSPVSKLRPDDMRYENPFYMAEDAGAADLICGGRLQLGINRGSPEQVIDGFRHFGYQLGEGETDADMAPRFY